MTSKFLPILTIALALQIQANAQTTGCQVTGTTPGEACYNSTGQISATASSGSSIRWYTQQTGGTAISVGNTLTINNALTPTTYYAEAFDGGVLVKDSLNTLTPNNGQVGAYFDCKPKTDVTVTGFNFVPNSSGTFTVKIYWKSGTHVGNETNNSAWTLLGSSSSFSGTGGAITRIPVTISKQLTANQTYAFYIIATNIIGYTNGSSLGSIAVQNSDMIIYQGRGSGGAFSSSLFTPRTFAGTMLYEKGGSCTSNREPVQLNIIDSTKIDKQSTFDTTCVGLPLSLHVHAKGNVNTYKWQIYSKLSGTYIDITGNPFIVDGDTLNIPNTPDTLNGALIRCITIGQCGSDESSDMLLAVESLPAVTTPPQDQNLKPGDVGIFTVVGAGKKLKYQWQAAQPDSAFVNINEGGIYKGVKTSTLYVKGVSRIQDRFKFRCVVSGTGNCAVDPDTSNFAVLYVEPAASVSTVSADDQLVVYPNPASGSEILIKSNSHVFDNAQYVITDKLGRRVAAGTLGNTQNNSINISNLPADVYTITVATQATSDYQIIRFTKL